MTPSGCLVRDWASPFQAATPSGCPAALRVRTEAPLVARCGTRLSALAPRPHSWHPTARRAGQSRRDESRAGREDGESPATNGREGSRAKTCASPTPAAHPALELDSSLTGAENSVPPHVRQAAAGRAYKARARADAARADAATRAADACATELRAVKAELERLRHARDERVETQHVARVGNVRVLVEAASHCRVRLRIVPAD
eukprot:scaffold4847_cov130-Isochrysis_galbana.AAC.1